MSSSFWKLRLSLGFELFVGQNLYPDLDNVLQSDYLLNVL